MSKISGIRDLDRELISKVEDRELLKVCSIDKYTWEKVCDDKFLKRRLLLKYPEIEIYKSEKESWKYFFSKCIYYIFKMKKAYGYDYRFGNFITQDRLLYYANGNNILFIESVKVGELALVIWSLKNGANIHFGDDDALMWASQKGQLEVVKYLLEHGANIRAGNFRAFRMACDKGHLEVVKYLVEHGSDIHTYDDLALRWASEKGHVEVVKYLESLKI